MAKSIIKKQNKASAKTKIQKPVKKKEESRKVEPKAKDNSKNKEHTDKDKRPPAKTKAVILRPETELQAQEVHPVQAMAAEPPVMGPEKSETINSLKELEEKILEKFDEHGLEILEVKEAETEPVKEKEHKEKVKPDHQDYTARVEAILFAVGKYLDEETISQLCDIDKRNVKKSLEELRKDYDSRNTALMIVQEGSNWKINVREKYLSLVRKIVSDTELSKSIMETLAVIAWKTPVYQNEIVRIRGNKCYDHIEELVNAGFITKDKKGRSYILKTTEKFYNYFDIDQKNLQGIMSEAKMPITQTTLEEVNKQQETEYSREKLLETLEKIETKKIVHTEEDKNSQREFLAQIHQKIEDASKRTDEVIADIPKPMHQQNQDIPTPADAEAPPAVDSKDIVENDEEDIVIDTGVENGEHHFQKPEGQPQKPKQLTKKQLEKKFKEELQRVKDKSEQKK